MGMLAFPAAVGEAAGAEVDASALGRAEGLVLPSEALDSGPPGLRGDVRRMRMEIRGGLEDWRLT